MSSEVERRAPGTSRTPFEALVEVGGALGPSFEAQAVNISEEGMQLRTAYLPEPGQPLTCRFDAGPDQNVMASGEVVWAKDQGKGGEFAIRFTDVDAESIDALRRMCGVSGEAPAPVNAQPGSRVRLHIEGLASPMRARVKDSKTSAVTVGSDLGFLQVGKELELEDAESGQKRAARIDRVEVAVDPNSRVPQLVVTLRYDGHGETEEVSVIAKMPKDDGGIRVDVEAPVRSSEMKSEGDLESAQRAANEMKGAFARSVASIGPTFAKLGSRAKTTVALLAAKRAASKDEPSSPRRTTAPAPGGGLHAAGRRVVRGESSQDDRPVADEAPNETGSKLTKRKVAIGGAVLVAVILGALAMKKPSAPPAAASAENTTAAAASVLTAESRLSNLTPPVMPIAPQPPATMAAAPIGAPAPTLMGNAPMTSADMSDGSEDDATGKHGKKKDKHAKIPPFGNGPVAHGNILHLKMDGPIDAIQGAQQPTGFTVKLPNRKSIEAAGPLAARDSRIASIKVANDPAGAELTLAFKDGVPNYQVRAKNDTLEIALAPMGKAHNDKAPKDGKPTKVASKKHAGSPHGTHDSHD